MPELPEVETTINELKPALIQKRITAVTVFTGNTISGMTAEQFQQELTGRQILDITRRGKFLVFSLDNGYKWIVHLRMTGALILKKEADEPEKFIRVIIRLSEGKAVHFRDVRRFGRMWLVKDARSVVGKLGIEPLSEEFTPEALASIFQGRTTPLKTLLLDQKLIAGIGNMYADEALYQARIHPQQKAGSLTTYERRRLYDAIQLVLRKGIRNKGASTDTYIRPDGGKGGAHLEFQVAHRKGAECPVCSGTIERITVGQRGTFFCPACQKLRKAKTRNAK
jgi:formamidopyrimidine-DNA glycosylase